MPELTHPMPQIVAAPVKESVNTQREPYIGSVLFFKHLFLAILLAMIFVPTTLCVLFAFRLSALDTTARELRSQLESVTQELEQAQGEAALLAVDQAVIPAEPTPDVELPAYSSLYPDFYAPEAAYSSVVTDKVCYLTFDDGPSARTDEVLDILAEEGIKATFFVTKQDSEANRARLIRIAQEGHTIGLHSATHQYGTIYSSVEAFLADYYELYTWVVETTGQRPTVFRFPGGSINGYNRPLYQELIAEMNRRGFVYFDWNVSSADATASLSPADTIRGNCARDLAKFGRAIVLMHDSNPKTTTVAALPGIIEDARSLGFTLEALTPEVKPIVFSYRE